MSYVCMFVCLKGGSYHFGCCYFPHPHFSSDVRMGKHVIYHITIFIETCSSRPNNTLVQWFPYSCHIPPGSRELHSIKCHYIYVILQVEHANELKKLIQCKDCIWFSSANWLMLGMTSLTAHQKSHLDAARQFLLFDLMVMKGIILCWTVNIFVK